jgi:hypothetical protein
VKTRVGLRELVARSAEVAKGKVHWSDGQWAHLDAGLRCQSCGHHDRIRSAVRYLRVDGDGDVGRPAPGAASGRRAHRAPVVRRELARPRLRPGTPHNGATVEIPYEVAVDSTMNLAQRDTAG